MSKTFAVHWGGARFQRRTIYVSPYVAQRIHDQATAMQIPVSEQIRRLVELGRQRPAALTRIDVPGPQSELLWVYLPRALDQHVRVLARQHHWSLAATLRRLLAAGLAANHGEEDRG